MPFLNGESPQNWRREAHWEYDFRDPVGQMGETAFHLTSDQCSLAVLRGHRYKYVHFAAQPPLLFDLEQDPGELINRAEDPAYRDIRLDCASRMLSWRMAHAERVLANHFVTGKGVIERRPTRR
jgi:arylsulfatase A-like enzyme